MNTVKIIVNNNNLCIWGSHNDEHYPNIQSMKREYHQVGGPCRIVLQF